MSDSEDDFMSDKFLVEAPKKTEKSYSARRSQAQLHSQRLGQSKQLQSHKVIEEQRRREGLSRSLFEIEPQKSGEASGSGLQTSSGIGVGLSAGGNKAMEMMMKMGWKVGEGLGKTASEEDVAKRKRDQSAEVDREEEDEAPRGGLGSTSRAKVARTEPIRISLWSGRRGLTARDPTPPPLPSHRNPDALDPKKLQRLGQVTDNFRERQKAEFSMREVEKREWKARELLMQFDEEKGIKVCPCLWHLSSRKTSLTTVSSFIRDAL